MGAAVNHLEIFGISLKMGVPGKQALALLDEALRLVPEDPYALLLKGLAAMDALQYRTAGAALDAASQSPRAPGPLSLAAARARLEAMQGNEASARIHMDVLNKSRVGTLRVESQFYSPSFGNRNLKRSPRQTPSDAGSHGEGRSGPLASETLTEAELLWVRSIVQTSAQPSREVLAGISPPSFNFCVCVSLVVFSPHELAKRS